MKKNILISAMMLMVCGIAQGQDAGVYIGAKGGSFQISLDETNDPNGAGILIGYNFGQGPAIEFEHNKSQSINIRYYGYYIPSSIASAEIETNALYLAYRSQGTVFFKVKGGYLQEKVTGNVYYLDLGESDTGLSLGAGIGVNMGDVAQLEVEYTLIEQDVGFVSLGLNLRF